MNFHEQFYQRMIANIPERPLEEPMSLELAEAKLDPEEFTSDVRSQDEMPRPLFEFKGPRSVIHGPTGQHSFIE